MSILRLTVVLEEVKPRVSRTLLVPSDLRLDRLHLVLQAAMGWEHSHLYRFAAGSLRWSAPEADLGPDVLPSTRATLQEALAAAEPLPLHYTYDFGDDWRHLITAAPAEEPLPGQLLPLLLDAVGRCPPEDVGGPSGYQRFLKAIANPKHPDHAEVIEWYGGPFDPTALDTDAHRLEVLALARRWSPRKG